MTMTATLEVPPEYLRWIRYAALKEMGQEAKSLSEHAAKTIRDFEKEDWETRHGIREPVTFEHLVSDLNGARRHARDAIDVAAQLLDEEKPEMITGRPEALCYVLDAMTRKVISGELREQYGPMEGEEGENMLAPFIAALEWAGSEGARLRALDGPEAAN